MDKILSKKIEEDAKTWMASKKKEPLGDSMVEDSMIRRDEYLQPFYHHYRNTFIGLLYDRFLKNYHPNDLTEDHFTAMKREASRLAKKMMEDE